MTAITQPIVEERKHEGLCVDHPWQWCHPRVAWDPDSTESKIRRRLKETAAERPEWEETHNDR
jgi:hypothetical protein